MRMHSCHVRVSYLGGARDMQQFGLGARGRPGYIGQDPDWQLDYVDALLAAARRPSAELTALRTRMKSSARQRFSWRSVAAQWSAVFQNATAIAPPEADDAKGTLDAPSPPNGIQARRRASGAATRSPSARKSPPVPPSSQPRVKQTEQGMQKVFLEVGLDEVIVRSTEWRHTSRGTLEMPRQSWSLHDACRSFNTS